MWSPPAPQVKAGQVSENHLFPRKSRHKWTCAQIGLSFVSKMEDFCTKMKAALLFSISWGIGGCQDHVVLIKRWTRETRENLFVKSAQPPLSHHFWRLFWHLFCWEYWGGAQMKALRESFLKHPLKIMKSYLTPDLLAIEKKFKI